MSVQYLRGNATASATALFVICRHLRNVQVGQSLDALARTLQPPTGAEDLPGSVSAVLKSSLDVGEAIGILQRDGDLWLLTDSFVDFFGGQEASWPLFRARLMLQIMSNGSRDGVAPDLVLGMGWFLRLDPLVPLDSKWADGPELIRAANFEAIARSEQWLAFIRWAIALGVARNVQAGRKRVIIPDATTAIADQLSRLPGRAAARTWLTALAEVLPVTGAEGLVRQLPTSGRPTGELAPAVALALLKLERRGAIELLPTDDASDVVSVAIGRDVRQVGQIVVRQEIVQ